jgi:hypothetical protein
LGKDLGFVGLEDLLKYSKSGKLNSQSFGKAVQTILNAHSLSHIGLRVGAGVITKVIENGFNNVTNGDTSKIPFVISTM